MLRRAARLALALSLGGCSLFVLDEGEFTGGRGPATDSGVDAAQDAATTLDGGGGGDGGGGATEAGAPDASNADGSTSKYASTIVADGPILYLRFGDTGGTTAKATVGSDGTYAVAGVSLGAAGALAGDPDPALTLDGTGTVSLPGASFDGLTPFSVELWVKPSATNTTYGFVVDNSNWNTPRRGWTLLVGEDGTGFERWENDTDRTGLRVDAMSAGAWHHVVGTFDGATVRLYVDAVRVSSAATSVSLPARTSTLTVGNQSCDCSGNGFIGSVDELAIYDRPLTEMQIAAHFAAAK